MEQFSAASSATGCSLAEHLAVTPAMRYEMPELLAPAATATGAAVAAASAPVPQAAVAACSTAYGGVVAHTCSLGS